MPETKPDALVVSTCMPELKEGLAVFVTVKSGTPVTAPAALEATDGARLAVVAGAAVVLPASTGQTSPMLAR
jgi:hypothetical protein